MRGIEVYLNYLRPVGVGPRKICAELKQHVAVQDRVIAGIYCDNASPRAASPQRKQRRQRCSPFSSELAGRRTINAIY
jgi:hypothetical protein